MSSKMPPLNLPPVDLRLVSDNGLLKVWDRVRNEYVALTPEEFVRQHFVEWLINDRKCPQTALANEVRIELNGMRKRCDTVVYNRQGQPVMIVEYKAPGISISQKTFDQIVRYNHVLKVKYLVVSNGLSHYCCVCDIASHSYNFIPVIPTYHEMINPFSES